MFSRLLRGAFGVALGALRKAVPVVGDPQQSFARFGGSKIFDHGADVGGTLTKGRRPVRWICVVNHT